MKIGLPYLEWEALHKPITISKVDERAELPSGKKRIEINRDENYNIIATLHFFTGVRGLHGRTPLAGSFSKAFDIHGSASDLVSYTLESCTIGSTKIKWAYQGQKEPSGTAIIQLGGLREKRGNAEQATHLIEWYLNGPEGHIFHRPTKRKEIVNYSRERFARFGHAADLQSKEEKIDSIKVSTEAGQFGGDFLRIESCGFQFIVAKVLNGLGPSWSSNIGVEYRKDWGRIPDQHEREMIEELCSFVFGRQLLSIGYTIYDKNENLVEAYTNSPWAGKARSYCSAPHYPPIRIGPGPSREAEDVIRQLLPKYYELRKPLNLMEALWNYWLSLDMPAGTNLPILATAIESIMNGWFKYKKSKSRGVYLKKAEYETLLEEEIKAIREKLETIINNKPDVDKIMAGILTANIIRITERYRAFFREIDLLIREHEWKAIGERHRFVHGRAIFAETDWEQCILHYNTLQTLLHRILLKLLGYSGTFIDRSVLGWRDEKLS